jgi:DNA-binding NarL/FixJ family response regulator
MRPIWDRLNGDQKEICELMFMGLNTKAIAAATHRSPSAITNRFRDILDITGMDSRLEVAVLLTAEKMKATSL